MFRRARRPSLLPLLLYLVVGCSQDESQHRGDSSGQRREARGTLLSAGGTTTCALVEDGAIACWGADLMQSSREGNAAAGSAPKAMEGIRQARAVAVGDSAYCLVDAQSKTRCWGRPFDPSRAETWLAEPQPIKGLPEAMDVRVGTDHGCVLTQGGEVWCFGQGAHGAGETGASWAPALVEGLGKAKSMSAGGSSTCAVTAGGDVFCWGDDTSGQPTEVKGISEARLVTVSKTHACALIKNGEIRCWGSNKSGQIGTGTTSQAEEATLVEGISKATEVAAGEGFTVAVTEGGDVYFWGIDTGHRAGGGDEAYANNLEPSPAKVPGLSLAAHVTAGPSHACAALRDGTLRCFGNNLMGQLGTGQPVYESTPVAVAGVTKAKGLSANRDHTCVVLQSGRARCWGRVWPYGFQPSPRAIPPIKTATAIGAGSFHGCALLEDGTVSCWGSGDQRRNGNRAAQTAAVAAPVEGVQEAQALAVGGRHSCVIEKGGHLRCWGDNAMGQAGLAPDLAEVPPTLLEDRSFDIRLLALASSSMGGDGVGRSCVLTKAGELHCWGDWGNQEPGERHRPLAVSLPDKAAAFDTSSCQSCVATEKGRLTCWRDPQGEVRTHELGSHIKQIALSGDVCLHGGAATPVRAGHGCALTDGGEVYCWGPNAFGQAGQDPTNQSVEPTKVAGLSKVLQIATGLFHSCALVESGSVRCWGTNSWGQLGSGRTLSSQKALGVCATGRWNGTECSGGQLLKLSGR